MILLYSLRQTPVPCYNSIVLISLEFPKYKYLKNIMSITIYMIVSTLLFISPSPFYFPYYYQNLSTNARDLMILQIEHNREGLYIEGIIIALQVLQSGQNHVHFFMCMPILPMLLMMADSIKSKYCLSKNSCYSTIKFYSLGKNVFSSGYPSLHVFLVWLCLEVVGHKGFYCIITDHSPMAKHHAI